MTFGELVNSGIIKSSTKFVLSTDMGSGIATEDTFGNIALWQYMKYKDRGVVSISGVKDHLNIIIEEDYM